MSMIPLVALQMGGGQMGNGMGPGGWGFGFGFVGLAVMALVLGTIGYLLVSALGGSDRAQTGGRDPTVEDRGRATGEVDPALEELRKQYARGEIDDAEFERRAERLGGDTESAR